MSFSNLLIYAACCLILPSINLIPFWQDPDSSFAPAIKLFLSDFLLSCNLTLRLSPILLYSYACCKSFFSSILLHPPLPTVEYSSLTATSILPYLSALSQAFPLVSFSARLLPTDQFYPLTVMSILPPHSTVLPSFLSSSLYSPVSLPCHLLAISPSHTRIFILPSLTPPSSPFSSYYLFISIHLSNYHHYPLLCNF